MKDLVAEFKAFAMKGNVLDLAVAVVIGAAFGKIVSSLVDNIVMPIVGVFLGGVDLTRMSAEVGDAVIEYGYFLQSVIDFVIVAFAIFMMIKMINKASQMNAEDAPAEEEAPAEPSEEVKLLREIRDGLRRN